MQEEPGSWMFSGDTRCKRSGGQGQWGRGKGEQWNIWFLERPPTSVWARGEIHALTLLGTYNKTEYWGGVQAATTFRRPTQPPNPPPPRLGSPL
ncbi:hypothetical protein GQ53DRAFT_382112 [Thozetella sp. PMI_491]|nr:hypothetical protein GQ53DRAFT_382112 [Thozetella sp. PMI_491]